MEVQNVLYGSRRCDMPVFGKKAVKNDYYRVNSNVQGDSYTPSFGLKPLAIPDGMFKTAEEAADFSKLVEQVRTGKISKATAQKLVGENSDTNLLPQILDFIRKHDAKIKLYDDAQFNNWFDYKISEALVAMDGKKAQAFISQSNDLI